MGIGKKSEFISNSTEYSTPLKIFNPLKKEFGIEFDVCANSNNAKCKKYWTKEDNAFAQFWTGVCWMNPPFSRQLKKWVEKAYIESRRGVTVICLLPVRSNTKWWADYISKGEIRFINGEVKFSNAKRGLWMPMCIVIFGKKAKIGQFSIINYRQYKRSSA